MGECGYIVLAWFAPVGIQIQIMHGDKDRVILRTIILFLSMNNLV